MPFISIANAVKDVVLLKDGYSDKNVVVFDMRILAESAEKTLVIMPAEFQREIVASPRRLSVLWTINLHFTMTFYGLPMPDISKFIEERDALIAHLDKYPTLNSATGVINCFLDSGQNLELPTGEGRNKLYQLLRFLVEERSSISIA
jgi:hypothetical protein